MIFSTALSVHFCPFLCLDKDHRCMDNSFKQFTCICSDAKLQTPMLKCINPKYHGTPCLLRDKHHEK